MSKVLTIVFFINAFSIPLISDLGFGSVLIFVGNILAMAYFAGSIYED